MIRNGYVVSVDPDIGDLPRGDVLVEGSTIAAVGPDLQAEGCEVIEATDCVVIPGFVDTHRHTWQAPLRNIASDWSLFNYLAGLHSSLSGHFRPEDTYAGNFLGALEWQVVPPNELPHPDDARRVRAEHFALGGTWFTELAPAT